MADLFGLPLSVGTIVNLEQATVQAVAEPVAEARAYVPQQPTAYLDETGWREGQQRAWLWTAVTAWVTVFVVRRSRSGQVAQELLGERCWGYLVTDRWSAYTWYPTWRRQVCWAHLLRDIEAMIERGGQSQVIGEALRGQARQMFQWWHRVRDGTLAHTTFARYMWPIRREVERWLDSGANVWRPENRGDVPGDPQSAPGVVDLCPACRGGATPIMPQSARSVRESSGAKGALAPRVPTGPALSKR